MTVGAKTQLGYGFEQTGGVGNAGQKTGTFYWMRASNFKLGPEPVYETRSNLDPRGQQLPSDIVGYNVPFGFNAQLNVDELARWLFHMQGYAAITNPAAGVYDWTYRDLLSSDSLGTDPARLSLEGDIDDGYAGLALNAAIDTIEAKVSARKIVEWTLNGMACRFTNLRDPEAVVGPATFSGVVLVRNLRHDTDAEDTTNDIKFKITTAGGTGVGKLKFTKGATAYGSVEYTITYGSTYSESNWIDVVYGDGTHASGDQLNPVQIQFIGTGAFVAGGTPDEWKIRAQRVKGTPSYSTRNPLKAGKCIVTVGGTTKDVEDYSILFKRPRKYRLGTASMWPLGILDDGDRAFSIKMKRDYFDRYFKLKNLSGTNVAFDATMHGGLIATVASVSYFEKAQFASTNAQVLKGGVNNVPNGKQLQEDIEIVPNWDGTNVDMTNVVRCTVSSLS